MTSRTIFIWALRNFLRLGILAIAVSFFVFRATELFMTINAASYVEAYYIAEGLDLPDAFRRISNQEQTWKVVHLVFSFVILIASFLIIYSFTLLRREDNGNFLCSEKYSLRIIILREFAILLSLAAPASVIGTILGASFLGGLIPFELTLFSASQMLGRGLPLPELWFIWMLFTCLILSALVGVFAIKKLKVF